MKEQILEQGNDPAGLEQLYRSDPKGFKTAFDQLDTASLQSPLMQFWYYRLREGISQKKAVLKRPLYLMVLMAIVCGLMAKWPDLLHLDKEIYLQRNIGFVFLPMLMLYFVWGHKINKPFALSLFGSLLVCLVFMNLLPSNQHSDTVALSSIHIIIVLWGLLGWAYAGGRLRDDHLRISYLKYIGDLVVMSGLMILAGLLLSAVTIGLFKLLGYSIEQWYGENIIVVGLSIVPLVATYLVDTNPQLVGRISPLIARMFSPLVGVMLFAYLIALFFSGKDPYNDREFLLTFNILLAGVMALIFFSVAETSGTSGYRYPSWILFSLSTLAAIVNGVALSAIAFRLTKYGFTPNRVAVTGANLLFFINLLMLVYRSFRSLTNPKFSGSLPQAIVLFLPVYFLWAVAITFFLPLLFSFR